MAGGKIHKSYGNAQFLPLCDNGVRSHYGIRLLLNGNIFQDISTGILRIENVIKSDKDQIPQVLTSFTEQTNSQRSTASTASLCPKLFPSDAHCSPRPMVWQWNGSFSLDSDLLDIQWSNKWSSGSRYVPGTLLGRTGLASPGNTLPQKKRLISEQQRCSNRLMTECLWSHHEPQYPQVASVLG